MAKKTVIKVSIKGEKEKRGILKAVANVEGITELSVDVAKGTLTVIGDADPVCIITCLRKKCGRCAEIDTVGPPKPPDDPKPEPGPVCPLQFCPPPCPPCGPCPSSYCCEYDADTCSIF